MTPLSSEQKELLFDHCMGLAYPEQIVEAQALISSNEEAAKLHSNLQAILAPLDSIEPEMCPDDLIERTMLRIDNAASSSTDRLGQLLAGEQMREVVVRKWRWASFARRLAPAAVFIIAASLLLPALGYLRYHSRLQRCQTQQSGFFQGWGNYVAQHRPAHRGTNWVTRAARIIPIQGLCIFWSKTATSSLTVSFARPAARAAEGPS